MEKKPLPPKGTAIVVGVVGAGGIALVAFGAHQGWFSPTLKDRQKTTDEYALILKSPMLAHKTDKIKEILRSKET
jgi:hypothetical protein